MSGKNYVINSKSIKQLEKAFKQGAIEAGNALTLWIGKPITVHLDSITPVPLGESMNLLGQPDVPVCCCIMQLEGAFGGRLALAFSDESGMALSEMLTGISGPTEWGELEKSSALESANILGCAFLNAMVQSAANKDISTVLPSPPSFHRDFAMSLLQGLFLEQAMIADSVLFVRTKFLMEGKTLVWHLLFIPDTLEA
ncbi:MAG: hypothetical protein EBT92_17105 [Planctomycetes bacterium]|nr:hypothetical protein [Planctomycetota bacterium]NBY00863.1 hypothetical protein [Planctomycetota bacterium]